MWQHADRRNLAVRLGIDFGTTRTVVACCDRGNYPVLSFQDAAGDPVDFYPSVVAERHGELRFGLDALAVASDPAWSVLRSFKRVLSGPGASPDLEIAIGETKLRVLDLLTLFLKSLRDAVLHRSNRPKNMQDDERLVCVVATPANAHGTQRFVTLDAFRRAGFEVAALLNEPSAAGFEYTHRYRSTITSKREHIVVYDLGGGTFDASLVHMTGRSHDAVATAGLNHLGGDDFDAVLTSMVLDAAGIEREALPARALAALADQCREAKERLNPNSRRIVIDLEACLGDRAGIRPPPVFELFCVRRTCGISTWRASIGLCAAIQYTLRSLTRIVRRGRSGLSGRALKIFLSRGAIHVRFLQPHGD